MFRQHRGEIGKFKPIERRHDRVIVIASGPSGAGPWPVHPGVPVIAVNGAVDGLGFAPDYWFTIDPTPINMARFRALTPATYPIIATDPDVGPDAHEQRYRQDFTGAHLLCLKRGQGMTEDRRMLGVGNSGRAAIHLAMHMGATRIGVFGVDGTDDPHWHNPELRSGNLKSLGRGCAELSRAGVEIVFADTGRSTVQGHLRAWPEDVLEWIAEDMVVGDGFEPSTSGL